ncbi:hypothetical protein [Cysteiniphilum sp. QT6929]|nr:hypothetical protein [Cysteiniphilum sp. QT6929]WHN66314.1 hypothetical protein NYP54_03535 [Cysteiniphilum sp. QT6929]
MYKRKFLMIAVIGVLSTGFAMAQSSKENCDDKHGGCLLDVSMTGDNAEHQFIIRQTCGQGGAKRMRYASPALDPAYNHGGVYYNYYTHNNSKFTVSSDKPMQVAMDRCKKNGDRIAGGRGELFAYEVIDVTGGNLSYGRQWQVSYAFSPDYNKTFYSYAHCKAIMVDTIAHTWYCANPRY